MTNGKTEQVACKAMRSGPVRSLAFVAALVMLGAQLASACTVPVFRYALDHWPADTYKLEATDADAHDDHIAFFLRNIGTSMPLNLEGYRMPKDAAAPSRLLFPHAQENQAAPVWEGKLDAAKLATLTNSPTRAEIVRHILSGDTAVWIYVENGDQAADDAAAAKVEKRLRYLEQVAQLPAIDPNDPDSQLGPGPALKLKYSLLRVRAGAPEENAFLQMLAGFKPDPAFASGSWLATVFGRGRVLGAWPVKDFEAEQVDEVCMFLMGSCSCQVKRMNPGWDLLLAVDWDKELLNVARGEKPTVFAAADKVTPALSPNGNSGAPETVQIQAKVEPAPAPAPTTAVTVPAPSSNWGIVAAGLLVLGGLVVWMKAGAQSKS